MVTPRTICRCFKRADFRNPAVTEPTPEEESLTPEARVNCVVIPWDTADADIILNEDEVLQTHAIYVEEIANELFAPVGNIGITQDDASLCQF